MPLACIGAIRTMRTNRGLFVVCPTATLAFFILASAPLSAQSVTANTFSTPHNLLSTSSTANTASIEALDSRWETARETDKYLQPPPRRYGRPKFSNKTSNSDGSAKYEFLGGIGVVLPLGDTHVYELPSWGLQVGAGRNFNRNFGVMLQFDYDHFALQRATLANETSVYNTLLGCTPAQIAAGSCVTGLGGNNHVWSFTLNPTFTLPSKGPWSTYAEVGGGFYHKVTNFTQPATQETCSIYGCGYFSVNENIDHYTSNAGGVNAGFGFTGRFSQFSNVRFYIESRYVLVLNQHRDGVTAANASTAPASATNLYPANSHRTTYVPLKLGLRF